MPIIYRLFFTLYVSFFLATSNSLAENRSCQTLFQNNMKPTKYKLSSEEKYILSRIEYKIAKMTYDQKKITVLTILQNKMIQHSRKKSLIVTSALSFALYRMSGLVIPLIPDLKNDSKYKIPQELLTKISENGIAPYKNELIQHYKDNNQFNLKWRKFENYFTYGLIFYAIYLMFEDIEKIEKVLYLGLNLINFLTTCQADVVQYQNQNFDIKKVHSEQMNSYREGYYKIYKRHLDPNIPEDAAILKKKWATIRRQSSTDLKLQTAPHKQSQCE